jgi:hypothetical protein
MLTKLGISSERFRVEYVPAEGIHYAEVIKEIDADMKTLWKAEIQAENTKLKPMLENMLRCWKKPQSSIFSFTLYLVFLFLVTSSV